METKLNDFWIKCDNQDRFKELMEFFQKNTDCRWSDEYSPIDFNPYTLMERGVENLVWILVSDRKFQYDFFETVDVTRGVPNFTFKEFMDIENKLCPEVDFEQLKQISEQIADKTEQIKESAE
jgi:hypothetical protein